MLETEEHLQRVLGGRHALLTWLYYIRTIIASRFTDSRGYTPLHTSRTQYYVSTGYGWGFRSGNKGHSRGLIIVQFVMWLGFQIIQGWVLT